VTHPSGIPVFERFFRAVASSDIDKNDVRRFREIIDDPADVTFSEDTEQLLPELFGGLSIALARSFRVVDPTLVNPSTEHWERVFTFFRLVF
jgi:hypothetical protein